MVVSISCQFFTEFDRLLISIHGENLEPFFWTISGRFIDFFFLLAGFSGVYSHLEIGCLDLAPWWRAWAGRKKGRIIKGKGAVDHTGVVGKEERQGRFGLRTGVMKDNLGDLS